jgi:hypothetical protein
MPALGAKVNLLPSSDFETSFWGRFLKWAVTTGRYIIILTELVVIIAFLSRFKLDEDLRNLNEQINGQVSFLQLLTGQENEFLSVQKRVGLAGKILVSEIKVEEYLNYLKERLPPEVIVRSRSVSPEGMSFSGVTTDEAALGQLLATMSADEKWSGIEVTDLTRDKTSGIKFSLSAKKAF